MTSTIDFRSLDTGDVARIGLQRTRHLARLPQIGSISYGAWNRGYWWPLRLEARLRRREILEGTMRDIQAEFDTIAGWIGDRPVARMMDIGCGHAMIDLLFWQRYGCAIHLVDIEESESTHHDYYESGSGYASLESARRFLTVNGVPEYKIALTNPQRQALAADGLDLIVSMISAGFHYPISTYTDFALSALKPGGVLIFDARKDTGQEAMLTGFDRVEIVDEGLKHRKLAAFSPRG